MSLSTKTLEHVVPAYNLPRGRAVDRGKVAGAAQQTAEAEDPRAAHAQAAEGRLDGNMTARPLVSFLMLVCDWIRWIRPRVQIAHFSFAVDYRAPGGVTIRA
jgi:hypothetical protein